MTPKVAPLHELGRLGYRVLRVDAALVLRDLERALAVIRGALGQ